MAYNNENFEGVEDTLLLSQDVRKAKGKGNLDKTYMDSDDDDEEFEDADEEE